MNNTLAIYASFAACLFSTPALAVQNYFSECETLSDMQVETTDGRFVITSGTVFTFSTGDAIGSENMLAVDEAWLLRQTVRVPNTSQSIPILFANGLYDRPPSGDATSNVIYDRFARDFETDSDISRDGTLRVLFKCKSVSGLY